jgi:RND superfamily putative drug exporter
MNSVLGRLGRWCWKHHWLVLVAWALLTLVASAAAPRLSERLLSGSGTIAGSQSLLVDEEIRRLFPGGQGQNLLLVFHSPTLERHPEALARLREQLEDLLFDRTLVAGLLFDEDLPDPRLRPTPGKGHLVIISMATESSLLTEQEVPRLRSAVEPVMQGARVAFPDLRWAITGPAALTHDLNRFSVEDSTRSEIRALPLTLLILVVAFGSLVAAGVPLLLAVVTRTVALGALFLLADGLEISNIVQSIVTMLALALGIDYSLFLIHGHRRLAKNGGEAVEALAQAMEQSGSAILISGVTVAIGFGGLLVTPLMQTRSIGLGGLLAVMLSVLAALTLVPALLRALGRRLAWLRVASPGRSGRSADGWRRWGEHVLARPMLATFASLLILLPLAAPATQTRFGFPEDELLPRELEFVRGLAMLDDMQVKGLVSPVLLLVRSGDDRTLLLPARISEIDRLRSRLEADRRVRLVQGPDLSLASRSLPFPVPGAEWISGDERALLLKVIPASGTTLAELRQLAEDIPRFDVTGLRLSIGGQAQFYNDFDHAVAAAYPMTIALVLAMSGLTLLLFFRAPLVSAKALLLNLLSVAAGYGAVVFVFQLGHGADLLGVAGPSHVVPITIPLVIFCILFGLSMDYEIFLLSRVRTAFVETDSNHESILRAMSDTGSLITSAAMIMVVVFGAFAFSKLIIVQMIGLGLAVAVLVDALVIRSLLGPALMKMAGRWNWWPRHSHALKATTSMDTLRKGDPL